ncbi:MAG: protein DpdE [Mastigocoleus sp. MO_167.B18]|nr:protein DpdE [Mastigocoleus sp. MO_167.B18]
MIKLGSLVRSGTNNLGIGKIIDISDPQITVEYFCSVAQRVKASVPLNSLARIRLQPQTRCYIRDEIQDTWNIGRIYEWDEDKNHYQIDLPDCKTILAREEDIYVRCNMHIADPIETLAIKGHETPYFHDKRLNLVQSLIEQRALSHGMTGLISANIKLYPHQVEVIRRVLEDPIQRYLLADEVGLGKTIEAGAILRQYLLDESSGSALVVVPQYLIEQWRSELEQKFYISHFSKRVQIIAFEEMNRVSLNLELGLLIVDEAHHIAAMAASTDSIQRRQFQTCKQLAHKSDRLLLLSATPVLNNERDFLAMLHLLDPISYPLDNLEDFRNRVKKRSSVGKVLLCFQEGAKSSVLQGNLEQLRQLFAEDKYVLNLATELENCLQKNLESTNPESTNSESTDKLVRKIHSHISETYRLHNRMLRNRRAAVEDVIFDRNVTPKVEYDLDERSFDIHELIENWRQAAPKQEAYKRIFVLLFRGSGTWLGVLKDVITARFGSKSSAMRLREFSADDVQKLTEIPLFEGEEKILQNLLQIINQPSEDGDRLELLKTVILYRLSEIFELQSWRSNLGKLLELLKQRIKTPIAGKKLPKIVVFTSFMQTGTEIIKFLQHNFGENAVASHLLGQNRTQIEQNLTKFKNNPNCFILVCDSSGEEGHNLQFADWMINFDLPGLPSRLEQRIGRIDRIGRPLQVELTIFAGVDLEDSPHDAYYQLLKNGFRIFDRSIASLQYYADEKISDIETILFASGGNELLKVIPDIQKETVEEEVKISEQNILDEIDVRDESIAEYFQALDDYDARHQELQRAVEGWICQGLLFQQRQDINLKGVVRYLATKRTLVPANQLKSLFATHIKDPGTYDRRIANQTAGVKLYRIGEGFIKTLTSYIRWDDRGQAFAMWRTDESWDATEGEEWFGFRFDYVVETDLSSAKEIVKSYGLDVRKLKSLKRRTDALFPPLIRTVFIDARNQQMSIVEDDNIQQILQRNYSGKSYKVNRDYNLAKNRLAILDRFIPAEEWQDFCRQARTSSEELLKQQPKFIELCQQRALLAENKLETRINQLRLRLMQHSEIEQISNSSLTEELDTETALSQAVVEGIRHPSIRLDSVGFIVVSGQPPLHFEEEERPETKV